jgi:uncharacterized membrane protein
MAESAARPRDWRRIALPCSIVLNLFLLAVIGGHFYSRYAGPPRDRTMLSRLLARVEATLPADEAAAFKAVILRDQDRFLAARQKLLAARQELMAQITANPYSKAGTAQALTDWKAAWDGVSGEFSGTLVDALATVSPQGRRKLVAEHWGHRLGVPGP